MRVLRRGGVVFALIEKRAGLLAFEAVVVKADTIHSDLGRTLLSPQQSRGKRRQLFQFADTGFDALDDSSWPQLGFLAQRVDNGLAHGLGIHGLREDLQRDHVVIAVDDEAGQKIGFAENDAVGVGIGDKFLAIGDGGANAFGDERGQIVDRAVRDHADGDLRRRTVKRAAQEFAARIEDADDGAGSRALRSDGGFDDIRPIDPGMPRLQTSGSAGGKFHERLRMLGGGGRFFGHE